jgi:hypothetical protein
MRWRALAVVGLLGLGACVRVRPWQREIHARPVMQADPDPAERLLDDHVTEYREGSVGGTGVRGGGCGCN